MTTKVMKKTMKKISLALVSLCAMAAFTQSCEFHEQLCEKEHPHKSGVQFFYDWTKLPACYNVVSHNPVTGQDEKMALPNKTFIIGDRLLNQHVQSFGFYPKAPKMEDGAGYYISELPPGMTEDENHGIEIFDVTAGEYKFLTVSLNNSDYEYSVNLEKMDVHQMNNHFGDLWLSNKTYDTGAIELDLPFQSFGPQFDLNNYVSEDGQEAKYIRRLSSPIIADSTGVEDCYTSDVHKITFHPTTITENVDLYFDIKKEITDDFVFEIDSIWCVLAGVPRRVNAGSGQLDISHTDKLIFPTNFVNTEEVPTYDSKKLTWQEANFKDTKYTKQEELAAPSNQKTKVRCHANLTLNGIVPNEDANKYAGTGVMQMIIFVRIWQYNTEDKKQEWVKQKVSGRVNLYNALKNNTVLTLDDEKLVYTKTADHVNLFLNLDATVTRKLLTGQSDDPFIGNWKIIEVDDEYNF